MESIRIKEMTNESNKVKKGGKGPKIIGNEVRTSQVLLYLKHGALSSPYFQKREEVTLWWRNVQSSSFDSQIHGDIVSTILRAR